MTLAQRVKALVRRLRPSPRDYAKVAFIGSMSSVPDEPGTTIYVVGTPQLPKWAVLECPCGQRHRLSIPLMKSISPHWTLRVKRGRASLSPSVSVDNDPCTSHFFLRGNRVEWARWNWEPK
jgi:hypothetical protein